MIYLMFVTMILNNTDVIKIIVGYGADKQYITLKLIKLNQQKTCHS